MCAAGVVANLLLAVPHLTGSAQAGVMRVLHSLASVPNAITTCFQRQQTVHSMMQILDSAAANSSSPAAAATEAAAQQRSTMSGGSSGGAQAGPDAGVSSRALEVLLSVCRADEAALKEIKDYPGAHAHTHTHTRRAQQQHLAVQLRVYRAVCLPPSVAPCVVAAQGCA